MSREQVIANVLEEIHSKCEAVRSEHATAGSLQGRVKEWSTAMIGILPRLDSLFDRASKDSDMAFKNSLNQQLINLYYKELNDVAADACAAVKALHGEVKASKGMVDTTEATDMIPDTSDTMKPAPLDFVTARNFQFFFGVLSKAGFINLALLVVFTRVFDFDPSGFVLAQWTFYLISYIVQIIYMVLMYRPDLCFMLPAEKVKSLLIERLKADLWNGRPIFILLMIIDRMEVIWGLYVQISVMNAGYNSFEQDLVYFIYRHLAILVLLLWMGQLFVMSREERIKVAPLTETELAVLIDKIASLTEAILKALLEAKHAPRATAESNTVVVTAVPVPNMEMQVEATPATEPMEAQTATVVAVPRREVEV